MATANTALAALAARRDRAAKTADELAVEIDRTRGADARDADARKSEPRNENIRHRRTKQAGARASWPEIRPNLRRAEVAFTMLRARSVESNLASS